MKRSILSLAAAACLAALAADAAEHHRRERSAMRFGPVGVSVDDREDGQGRARDIVSIGKGARLPEGQRAKNVVVIGGSAWVAGTVEEDVVVVSGQATVDGTVDGDVVAVGDIALGSGAVVRGDAVVVGGGLEAAPGAVVEGERTEVGIGLIRPLLGLGDVGEPGLLRQWVMKGLMWMRPLPHQVGWAWAFAGFMLAFYVLLALLFPEGLARCASLLETRPLSAFLIGVFAVLMAGPVTGMLAVSVVGLLAIPFLALVMAAAAVFGKAAAAGWMGSSIGRQAGVRELEKPAAAVAAGAALTFLLYAVPVVGLIVWALTAAFGTGAVLIAAYEALRVETRDGRPGPAGPGGRPAEGAGGELAVAGEPVQEPPAPIDGRRRAGFWPRAGATAVDLLVVVVLCAVIHIPVGWPLVLMGYQVGMWSWRSTTIGGIVFGMKGVRLDGKPMDIGVAMVRHMASYLSALAVFLGFLWAGWDPESQTWHDKLAGTVVVLVPKGEPLI